MNKNQLYALLSVACITGYAWLGFSYFTDGPSHVGAEMCLFKQLTNIPCPSCGSTRAVLSLLQGNFLNAFLFNPFGYIIFLILLIVPFWIIFDVITTKATLYRFYRNSESLIKQKLIAIPLIFIVILNWIWNIGKGL